MGLEVFKWHGDVSDSRKQSFRSTPADVLMTTPESLEVMLISARTDAKALFTNVSAVVIDEVHAFAGDDRGAHLASLLERITTLCGRDIQRIGLSATVGNPLVIGEWLQGSSKRPFRLVDPPRPKAQRELHIDFCEDIETAALGIAQLARNKKSLVFVESRAKAERSAQALDGSGVEVFIHHSSVSRADRLLAEGSSLAGRTRRSVCTSTMELGIDVGDLDHVIQVDAPSICRIIPSAPRSDWRRANASTNCTFFCLSPESLLQSVALLRLAESGWSRTCNPSQALHVLAHQVMALVLQEGGISRHQLFLPGSTPPILLKRRGAAAGADRHDGRSRDPTKQTDFYLASAAKNSTAGRTSSNSMPCSPRRQSCAFRTARKTSVTSRSLSSRCTTRIRGRCASGLQGERGGWPNRLVEGRALRKARRTWARSGVGSVSRDAVDAPLPGHDGCAPPGRQESMAHANARARTGGLRGYAGVLERGAAHLRNTRGRRVAHVRRGASIAARRRS